MSQPPSSSETAASKHSAEPELSNILRHYLAQDTQSGLRKYLLLKLQDPFTRTANGGFRLNALWASLGALAGLVLAVFLYFNLVRL